VLLRQVQAGPLQGDRLRALRRRGHALEGAPRAHGTHRPGRARLPHLVLQGRPQPHRLPDRHAAEGAREGPLLRGVDRHLGRRRGPHEGPPEAGEGGQEDPRRLRGRARAAHPAAERGSRAPHRLARGRGHQGRLRRGGRAVGRRPGRQPEEARRRRAHEAGQGHPQGDRVGDLRHRGLPRRRRRADGGGLEDLPGDEGQGRDQRRGRVPRSEGPLRLPVRLGRVLPRRHGRRVRARASGRGGPGGRVRGARADHQHLEGPEAGPRGEAAQGRLRLPQLDQPPGVDDPRLRAGDPAGAAADGPARRRALRDLGPERPLPARDQPQQPPQAAARPGRPRDHRQQREADAPGGGRRPVRQRAPRPARHRARQPGAQVALRHAEGQAGPLPAEPARKARRLLGSLGDRLRAEPETPPVRAAEADGAGALQAVHHGARPSRTSRRPRRWSTR
jgi:hypothetical protein